MGFVLFVVSIMWEERGVLDFGEVEYYVSPKYTLNVNDIWFSEQMLHDIRYVFYGLLFSQPNKTKSS